MKQIKRMGCNALLIAVFSLGLWSLGLGWGLTLAFNYSPIAQAASQTRTTDPIPTRYQPGYDSYIENCATCHIPVPPEVLPTETWRRILTKPEDHYGISIPEFLRLTQFLMWEYLSVFSRTLQKDEPIPSLVEQSRYFKALHPRVKLPEEVTLKTCVVCHPNAKEFDYRTLTPEWDNAP